MVLYVYTHIHTHSLTHTHTNLFPTDKDECVLGIDKCNPDRANCTDTEGSYTCHCMAGFSGDGVNCFGKYNRAVICVFCVTIKGVITQLALSQT